MNTLDRKRIVNQLQMGERLDVAPVLKLIESRFVGFSLKGFYEVMETSAVNTFSFHTKPMADDLRFSLMIRQYLGGRSGQIDVNCFMILELIIPEKRQAMVDLIDSYKDELLIVYGVTAYGELDVDTTKMQFLFDKSAIDSVEAFLDSRIGKFFIAKYNDYFLN